MANEQDKRRNKKIIKIRGHHLDLLTYWISEIDYTFSDRNYYTRIQKLKGHFIKQHMLEGYGKKFATKTWGLMNTLRNKDVRVKIIRSLDDICLADCKHKEKHCERDKDPPNYDKKAALYYKLKPGKIYRSREILDIIRKKEEPYIACGVIKTYYGNYSIHKANKNHPLGPYD